MRLSLLLLFAILLASPVLAQRPLPLTVTDSTNGPIYSVAIWQDLVYIGGRFTSVDSLPATNIAVKDKGIWKPLAQGVHGTVLTMCVDSSGGIYIGGKFDSVGSIAANNAAHWDGTQWHSLAAGVNDTIFSVLLDHDTLYCGGTFDTVNTRRHIALARWAATAWDTTNSNIDSGYIRIIARDEANAVAIGGDFWSPDSTNPIGLANGHLPIVGIRGGYTVPEVQAITFHRGGVLCAGPNIFSQLPGSAEQYYSQYLLTVKKRGDVVSLRAFDHKRFIASGTFTKIENAVDTFACFYDGAVWRSFSPTPPLPSFSSDCIGRDIFLVGGDSSNGYLAQARYRDSIIMTVSAPSQISYGSPDNLAITIRSELGSNDTLTAYLLAAIFEPPVILPGSINIQVPAGTEHISSFTTYPNGADGSSAVIALFSNSSSQIDPVISVVLRLSGRVELASDQNLRTRFDASSNSLIFTKSSSSVVRIYNSSGALTCTLQEYPFSGKYNVGALPKGLYFYIRAGTEPLETGRFLIY
jgi:hypothetical protein